MDITLLPTKKDILVDNYRKVSILVLMDITLLRNSSNKRIFGDKSFNPCFNGYYTFTRAK